MKKLVLISLALIAPVAIAGPVVLNSDRRYTFACSSGGSSAQTVEPGTYVVRFLDDNVTLCEATTCASGGDEFPSGTMLMKWRARTVLSCRSNGSGRLVMTSDSGN